MAADGSHGFERFTGDQAVNAMLPLVHFGIVRGTSEVTTSLSSISGLERSL